MYAYDDLFFSYLEAGSRRSARVVVPLLARLGPRSVADFGCGRGAWLQVWSQLGIDDTVGIDGPYMAQDRLLIPPARFRACDLSRPVDLGRRFDLATSFEVGEHLPTTAAAILVDNLCRHAPLVAFSAAVPGQGGEQHVNERPYAFWRALFAARGYSLFDCLRPRLADARAVEPWYRYNSLLFASAERIATLPADMLATRIADHAPIPDVSPLPFRLRKWLLRRLPLTHVNRIAVLKHRLMLARARLRGEPRHADG